MTAQADWSLRVKADPTIHHGEPCIAGTRVAVSVIVGSMADGDSTAQIIASYPQLTIEEFAFWTNTAVAVTERESATR